MDGWRWLRAGAAGIVIFVTAVVALQVSMGSTPGGDPVPAPGGELFGAYGFNGTLAGNGTAPSARGTPRYGPGIQGQALHVNNTSGVTVPRSGIFTLSEISRISVRIRPARQGKGYIVSRHDYDNRTGWALMMTTDGRIGFEAGTGDRWDGVYSEPVAPGEWHTVTAAYREGEMRLWIDGERVEYGTTLDQAVIPAAQQLGIGRASRYDGDRFPGAIDELRFHGNITAASYTFDTFSGFTPAGGPRLVDTPGGSGVLLDGNSSLAPHDRPAVGDTFTVESWIRPTNTSRKKHVIAAFNYTDGSGYLLAMTRDHKAEFRAGDGNGSAAIYSTPVEPGQWHHLAGVVADGTVRLYVDGKSVGYTRSFPGGTVPSRRPVIGKASTYDGDHFTGTINAIRISRAALRPPAFLAR